MTRADLLAARADVHERRFDLKVRRMGAFDASVEPYRARLSRAMDRLSKIEEKQEMRVWVNRSNTEWWSACSAEHAEKLRLEMHESGCHEFDDDPILESPLPIDRELSIIYHNGAAGGREYPEWVDLEPSATCEPYGKHDVMRVTAPCGVWCKNEIGLIGSTEW